MKLDLKYLDSYNEKYYGFHNALGIYDTMQFVVRLRTDVHQKLKTLPGIQIAKNPDFDTIQAFSTYLHETIHWWQHKGSTTGLILSLTYPMQTHINKRLLNDFLEETGAVKPIKKYNLLYAKKQHPDDKEFQIINQILNNFHDIEFFKHIVILPSEVRKIVDDPLFENIGHSFHITYSAFIHTLMECFDKECCFFPNLDRWSIEFKKLSEKKKQGFYFGSDVYVAPIGLKEIYEGQARFIQLQYLSFGGYSILWKNFEDLGLLSGVYIEAFDIYLKIINCDKPKTINDSLVGLFLVICDISINPTSGFPFDIENFDEFIISNDPGIRFINLCQVINNKFPEMKESVKDYSSSEYYRITTALCNELSYKSPIEGMLEIISLSEKNPALVKLLEEEKTFDFNEENFPIRLIFSQFLKFQKDKYENPEFFCWPGVYMVGQNANEKILNLFSEHEALFIDGIDGVIYPRILPNKDNEKVSNAMNLFYTWISSYDMTRQWILENGEFKYDYWWLTDKFDKDDMEKWGENAFKNFFNYNPKDFKVI